MTWQVFDSGRLTAGKNMEIDQSALNAMIQGTALSPLLRFFQWEKPAVSFGYLLPLEGVSAWAKAYNASEIVRRPTGGGAVFHNTDELSLSLLWPRESGLFPEKPRECYAAIHEKLKSAVASCLKKNSFSLYTKPAGSCAEKSPSSNKSVPVCFEEPVCNDVMLENRKVIGGALRITRQAILYQGSIQTQHCHPEAQSAEGSRRSYDGKGEILHSVQNDNLKEAIRSAIIGHA